MHFWALLITFVSRAVHGQIYRSACSFQIHPKNFAQFIIMAETEFNY